MLYGRRNSRPALDARLDAVRRREVQSVAITKLDRLARSTRHLCELAETFKALNVDLVVLDQAIDTATPTGKLLSDVLAAVAEFEAGLDPGAHPCGPCSCTSSWADAGRDPALLARVRRLRAAGQSLAQVASVLRISKSRAAKLERQARGEAA